MVRIDGKPAPTHPSRRSLAAGSPASGPQANQSFEDLLGALAPRGERGSTPLQAASNPPPEDEQFQDDSIPVTETAARTGEAPASRRKASVSSAKTGPRVDATQLLHKLVESFRIGQNRAGAMEVQMELKNTVFDGMRIQLAHGPEGLLATLTVERYAAKGALEGQIAELTRRLENQGIEVSDIQVALTQNSNDPDPDDSPEDRPDSAGEDPQIGDPARPGLDRTRSNSRASRSIQSATNYSL